jgi:hypothetical protein
MALRQCRLCGTKYHTIFARQHYCSDACRFWAKVDKSAGEDACWPWTAARSKLDYGVFGIGPILVLAHRFAYETTHGTIAAGICVLHRCDNPPCCNPAHHFLGTKLDNSLDMAAKGRWRNQFEGRTHCINGHAISPENTAIDKYGHLKCRVCCREKMRRRRADDRAVVAQAETSAS